MRSARKPAVSVGTTKPFTWPSSASFANTTTTSANVALPIQRFEPFSTQSSPSRRATVRSPRAESEPESGSVSPNAPSSSPVAIRGSRSSRCSLDPPTSIAPIARPDCTPTKVATEASTRAISSAAQPRYTAEFSNCRTSGTNAP